jgi:hypothetical protein
MTPKTMTSVRPGLACAQAHLVNPKGRRPPVFRYETAETAHGLCNALLLGRDNLAEVFRVHAGRESRGAHKVREHDSDLATFGNFLGFGLDDAGDVFMS